MGGSSSDNSFIPKRGPTNRPRRAASQQLYVFTLIAYVLFFGTLVATAGVFFYGRYIDTQLEGEVTTLNTEINRFHEDDMEEVRSFNNRLDNSGERVAAAASISSLLTTIEQATARSAQFERITLERERDNSYAVEIAIETDNFDSSIFQREFYEQETTINSVSISELDVKTDSGEEATGETKIAFTAILGVPISSIPVTPALINSNISDPVPESVVIEEVVEEVPLEEVLDNDTSL